jgi:leucyl aminopeptidase
MNVSVANAAPDADALAIICFEAVGDQPAVDPDIAQQSGWLAELRSSGEFTGKVYETVTLYRPQSTTAKRLVVIGGGKRESFLTVTARRIGGVLVRSLKSKGVKKIALSLPEGYANGEYVAALAEGAIVGSWEPDKYKTDPERDSKQVSDLVFLSADRSASGEAANRGRIIGEAQNFARDLVNEPGNKLTPAELAARAREMALSHQLEFEALDRDQMHQMGMGAILAVAQGSPNPPFLIVLKYKPLHVETGDHLALVGKGVTFDTGGVSIKPADGMEKMKYDMAGGAAVIGAMKAIAHLRPSMAVTAFVPTVENAVGGNAQRPGDIVTSLSGKTIEILNTDAEGRLILADAITYANRHGVTHMVDAATLTGAIGIALGHHNVGAFTNNQPMIDRVISASRAAGEKIWQLPLEDEYKEYLKSAFADLPNVGGRYGGSITAAWFLKEFADPTPWVHLDIASTAWLDDAKPWIAKGPSGVAVRSFVELASRWN